MGVRPLVDWGNGSGWEKECLPAVVEGKEKGIKAEGPSPPRLLAIG